MMQSHEKMVNVSIIWNKISCVVICCLKIFPNLSDNSWIGTKMTNESFQIPFLFGSPDPPSGVIYKQQTTLKQFRCSVDDNRAIISADRVVVHGQLTVLSAFIRTMQTSKISMQHECTSSSALLVVPLIGARVRVVVDREFALRFKGEKKLYLIALSKKIFRP